MDIKDRIRGCLIGGAAGDALGYAVEFIGEDSIFRRYGSNGITEYDTERYGKAVFSDDTQMTLFTANGFLYQRISGKDKDIDPANAVMYAYFDWLATQSYKFDSEQLLKKQVSWLRDVNELYSRRAPGNTCLSGLSVRLRNGGKVSSFLKTKSINNSKGCGTVMRAAPAGLCYPELSVREVQLLSAEISAITHGHPLGYLPSAMFAHIIYEIVYGAERPLKEIVLEAEETMQEVFEDTEGVDVMSRLTELAVELSENNEKDLDNIHKLGEGWVADEAFAIALYCVLKYENDFSAALTAAVNHKGDSDSTGAVAGNIIGALTGYENMNDKWKEDLELSDVIIEIADDIVQICVDQDKNTDPDIIRKYRNLSH